ncbi:hypothetical protein AB4K08_00810 [Serratia fonticola]|uniref:hypothetical protein n=1 Tax=Serratia fonticola TaxID=47917 RepID=UPI0034C69DA9
MKTIFKAALLYLLICLVVYLFAGVCTVFAWIMGDPIDIVFNWNVMRASLSFMWFLALLAMPGIWMMDVPKSYKKRWNFSALYNHFRARMNDGH